MAELCNLEEIFPVALGEGVHVHEVLALNFIGLPVVVEDVVPGGLLEFLLGEVGHPVFIL